MKTTILNPLKFLTAGICLLFSFLALNAGATVYYWDPEGARANYATYTTGSLASSWETANWSTSDLGTATRIGWSETGVAACFAVGAGATNSGSSASTTAFTVTMNSSHTVAGFFIGALNPNSAIVTVTSGNGSKITIPSGLQGFDILNSSDSSLGQLIINPVIQGADATSAVTAEGNGQIFLNGVNTYAGGTLLGWSGTSWQGIINFNSGSSFGTGPIVSSNGWGSALVAEGASAITVANAVQFIKNTNNLNIVGNTAGVTFSGPWALNGVQVSLGSGGAANNLVTVSGVVSGSGNLTKFNPGILALTGANSYTGGTTNSAGTISANTIADANCSIGPSGNFTFNGGTLQYTGSSAASTTRGFKGISGTTSTIDLPSGNLTLGNGITAAVSGAFTVNKTSGGTLTLAGASDDSYLAMNVNGGTVVLAKTVSAAHGLGGNSSIASGATLKLAGSGGDQIFTGVTITDNAGGTFDMGGVSEGFSMLLGSGVVTNSGSSASTLTLGEGNTGGVFSGNIKDGASGTVALTKTGTGALILNGANTYSGATTISQGTLAISNSGSLGSGTSITIAAGAILDVSGMGASATYTLGSGASLTASGTASASTIKGGATGTVNLGSQPINVTFDGTHAALTVSQGTLQLNGNNFTVNNTAAALAPGSYTIVSQTSGSISSSGTPTVSVTGNGVGSGNTASLAVSGGTVSLVVKASPAFTTLTTPSIAYGTASVVLTGKITSGTYYPAPGATVSATINGVTVNGSVIDTNANFSITYNHASLATDPVGSYTITYNYAGNSQLNPAVNSSTSLTITTAGVTVTANNQTKTYGQTVTFGSGSTNFTATGLKNGDTIGSVTLTCSGGASNAPVSGSPYTITPSAPTGGSFTPDNYSITNVNGTLTVGPAALGVTADNYSRAYGATNPVFTVAYTNFVNGQTLGTSDVVGSPALASADTNADVGAYAITNTTGTLASTNYTFALTNGVLTVTNALSTNVVTASTNTALPGAAVIFTSTLSTLAPSLAVPTNLVSFVIDSTNSAGSVSPSGGVAAITNSSLAHGYHTVEADYSGDTNALGATNILGSTNMVSVLINTPPVAGAATYGRPNDTALHIAISNLLSNATDADSDVITLLAVSATSTNGATIVTNGSFLTYTQAATNGNVTDTFTYTVQDSFGATNTGTVTVTNLPQGNGPAVNITGLNTLPNGTVQISFAGVPNYNYLIEAATNLVTPITWTILSTNTAGTNGLFQYTDLDATNYPTRYYRTARP